VISDLGGVEVSRAVARRGDDLARRCRVGLRGTAFQAEVVRIIHALLPVDAVYLPKGDARDLGRCVASVSGSGAT
jgi:hypothetical protein